MATLDQIETEIAGFYSGSTADNVLFGTMFVDQEVYERGYSELGVGSQTTRRLIGSKFATQEGIFDFFGGAWAPWWQQEGYVSGTFKGRIRRFAQVSSQDEFFFDSFMPSPVDIHIENGFEPTQGQTTEIRRAGTLTVVILSPELSGSQFDIIAADGPTSISGNIGIGIAGYPYTQISGSEADIVDTLWRDKYPFESRYKNISRLFRFSNQLPTTYFADKRLDGVPTSQVITSSLLGTITRWSDRHTNFFLAPFTTGANPINIAGFVSTPEDPDLFTFKVGTSPPRDLFNLYYGIGKGQEGADASGFPDPTAPIGNSASTRGPLIKGVIAGTIFKVGRTVIPQGYKYGIRSVAPERTRAIFRLSKFGQFRDMLEQRLYSKFLDTSRGQTSTRAAVEITFVSGTETFNRSVDYITATNPDYDARDTGFFDFEYKAGQPFFDG